MRFTQKALALVLVATMLLTVVAFADGTATLQDDVTTPSDLVTARPAATDTDMPATPTDIPTDAPATDAPTKGPATDTDLPTAAPTDAPTKAPATDAPATNAPATDAPETDAPTNEPSTGNDPAVPKDEDAADEEVPAFDGEDFMSRFQGNSLAAAKGSLVSGDTVTLTMDAADEDGYNGSVLSVYGADRADEVLISLVSCYNADVLLSFNAWQESVTNETALNETASYTSFVELARALVQALLPEKTADEVDTIIVSILQSRFDGTLQNADVTFGEDLAGEVVGYLAEEGYEFFLVLNDEAAELLVREAE